MALAEWSVGRVATACLAWLAGIPLLSIVTLLAIFWFRGRSFQRSVQGELGTRQLTVLFEYGALEKTLFLIVWLLPPVVLLVAWSVLRGGFDRPPASP